MTQIALWETEELTKKGADSYDPCRAIPRSDSSQALTPAFPSSCLEPAMKSLSAWGGEDRVPPPGDRSQVGRGEEPFTAMLIDAYHRVTDSLPLPPRVRTGPSLPQGPHRVGVPSPQSQAGFQPERVEGPGRDPSPERHSPRSALPPDGPARLPHSARNGCHSCRGPATCQALL